jgi:hypothetical protein
MGPVPKIMFPKGFQGAGLKSGAAGTVITFLSLPPETFLNVLYLVGTAPGKKRNANNPVRNSARLSPIRTCLKV